MVSEAESIVEHMRRAVQSFKGQIVSQGRYKYYKYPARVKKLGALKYCEVFLDNNRMAALNQSTYMAMAHAELAMLYRKSTIKNSDYASYHMSIAKGFSRFLHDELQLLKGGGYKWRSWWTKNDLRWEDSSHAATIVRFMVHAHQNEYFFSQSDMKRLAKTFHWIQVNNHSAHFRLHEPTTFVTSELRFVRGLARMNDLSLYDSKIYKKVKSLILSGYGIGSDGTKRAIGTKSYPRALYLKMSKRYQSLYKEL